MVRKALKSSKKSIYLFVLIFVVYALIYMTKNCYSAAMASIVSQGIMTKSQTGLIAAVFYLVYAPFQIVGGIAADRYSPRNLIVLGTFGAGVCNLLVYFLSNNYVAMLIIWSLNAIIQFGIWPSIFKIITSQLYPEHRSRAVFFINFASSIGLVFSYACAAIITDWRVNFLFSAIVLFLSVVAFLVVYHIVERDMVAEELPTRNAKAIRARDKETRSGHQGLVGLVIRAGIPLFLVIYIVLSLLNLGVKALVPVMLMESYEAVTPSLANALNIVLILCAPIGMFLSRLPIWKKFSEPVYISILTVILLPLLLVLTFIGSASLFIIMGALVLIMIAVSATTISFSYISKAFERYGCSGTISGIFNCMAALGIVLANYVFTGIAESFGWGVTTRSWLVLAVISLLLTLLTIPMWKRFLRKLEEGVKKD